MGENTPATALAELSRSLKYRLVPVVKPADELSSAISRAYSQQEGSAASVVDEVGGDIDLSRLMQDLPKVENLLESEDDALGHATLDITGGTTQQAARNALRDRDRAACGRQ